MLEKYRPIAQIVEELVRWFTRERLMLFLAILILYRGYKTTWYSLPSQALEAFNLQIDLIIVFQIGAALLGIICLIKIFWRDQQGLVRLTLYWGFLGVLLFPYVITTWYPEVSFLASTYYNQGTEITAHVERNFPKIQAQWKQNIYLQPASPASSTFKLAIEDSRFFQLSSWDRIVIEGLGYSKQFFGFIGKGWLFAFLGTALALVGVYLGLETREIDCFVRDMRRFLPTGGLLLGLILLSIIGVNMGDRQLDLLFAKGEYSQVVRRSETLASCYPPLRGDEAFLERLGKAKFYLDEPEDALVYFVKGLERDRLGDEVQAEAYYRQTLEKQPDNFLARGHLASVLVNLGVEYFNHPYNPYGAESFRYPYRPNFHGPIAPEGDRNSKAAGAAQGLEAALEIFPGHLLALYDLMLSRGVMGEYAKSAAAAEEIIELQKYFQQPSGSILGQAYLHLGWASYHDGKMNAAWKRYRQSIDPGFWSQPVD